jgi:hypothetical protein
VRVLTAIGVFSIAMWALAVYLLREFVKAVSFK